jgi:hypothetical protein
VADEKGHDRSGGAVTAWATWAEVGTALGTVVLAGATFSSVRSSSRTARIAERALLASQRPILAPSGPRDPDAQVQFAGGEVFALPAGRPLVERSAGIVYLAIPLSNLGAGIAVLRAYHLHAESAQQVARDPAGAARHRRGDTLPSIASFAPQQRDLLIGTGTAGFWQAALRDPEAPLFAAIGEALDTGGRITVDILYGDHEGGQPTVTRLVLLPDGARAWRCDATRYWNLSPTTKELREIGFR